MSIADLRTHCRVILCRITGMKNCDVCSAPFTPVISRQKRCSKKCNSIASNTRRRRNSDLKVCRTCKEDLPVDRYVPAHRSCIDCERLDTSGLKKCRGCDQVKPQDAFHLRATSSRPNRRDSRCKACRSAHARARNSMLEIQERARERKYQQKYGIGITDYDQMLASQGGCCAICRTPASDVLHVDHDHLSGKVRELLCLKCNSLLGQASDRIDVLRSAIEYLEKHHESDSRA